MSLAGRLEDLALADIFQILSVSKKTGTLLIKSSSGAAFIVFKNGLVVRAETNAINGSIGNELARGGLIKDSTLQMAEEAKKKLPDKSMAEILYELGSVNKDALEKFTKKRLEKIIYQLLLWEDGDFLFELDDLDVRGKISIDDLGWELAKGISPEYLLMEGARVHDETTYQEFMPADTFSDDKEETGWGDEWSDKEPGRRDISELKALTQELRSPNSDSEITLLILRFASSIFQRGILFMVSSENITGLGQFGLDIEKADERIRQITLPIKDSPFLTTVIKEKRFYRGAMEKDSVTDLLIKELEGGWPGEVSIFPIIAEGKVVAMLYCDNLPGDEPGAEAEGLEIFISQAGIALERALLQRKILEMEKKATGN